MNLEAIAPIIEDIIRQSLYEQRYKFGFDKYKGMSNKVASGTLANSIEVKFEKGGIQQNKITRRQFLKGQTGISNIPDKIIVLMVEYGQYVQSGRLPGKGFVPVGSLMKWIKERGLKGRDKKGKFITDKSFAFAIQKNIKKFGIRPANFLDVSIEKIFDDPRMTELMGEMAYEELINAIEGI
jgi:hypothetical protein